MTTRLRSLPLVGVLVLLAACGGDDHSATPTRTATPPPATPTATPNPLAQACRDSGGAVGSAACCLGTADFASSCGGIGACGCAPSASHQVARCECPGGTCWSGSACVAPATATPTATPAPDPLAQACRDSGGTVSSALCCLGSSDFPATCDIGACGCAPSASHQVARCDCPNGTCWNGSDCVADLAP
ncbi:hypothetical protein KF840_00155 [bacterium]|nr:hypothetical protein [bacterium]